MGPRHSSRPERLPFTASVHVFDGSQTRIGRVVNLSPGGVFVALQPPVPIGTGISFWVSIGTERVQVRGHVRWTRSLEAGPGAPVGSGIEFYDPDGSLARRVRDALAALDTP